MVLTDLFLRAWWWDWSGSSGCLDGLAHWVTRCLKRKQHFLLPLLSQNWELHEEVKKNLRILRSSLPGRSRAGSNVSGLLVTMIILTLCRESDPSIRVLWSSLAAEVPSEKRWPPMASIYRCMAYKELVPRSCRPKHFVIVEVFSFIFFLLSSIKLNQALIFWRDWFRFLLQRTLKYFVRFATWCLCVVQWEYNTFKVWSFLHDFTYRLTSLAKQDCFFYS